MTGINLSQSLQEKEAKVQGSFFDTGLYINLGILVFIGLIYGASYWYLSTLTKQLTELESGIAAKMSELSGPSVDRVADFQVRLDMIKSSMVESPDYRSIFSAIENKMVPNTRLTLYQENWVDGTIVLAGITDTLKYVAQEMLALKSIARIEKVSVVSLDYNDEGKLEFELKLTVTNEDKKTSQTTK